MSTAPVNPGYYADFSGLTSLKRAAREDSPQAIRQVARQFESLLTHMLLKSMREAKLGEGLGDSQETEFYQDMFDQQLSLQLSQGKGLGLADMLVQQLTKSGLAGGKSAHAAPSSATATIPGSVPAPVATPTAASVPDLTEVIAPPAIAAASSFAAARAASAPPAAGKAVSVPEQAAFVRQLAPYAERAAQRLGVTPDALIAHAALETGWGRHVPAGEAGSSNNLFGIKATGRWNGSAVTSSTVEYSGGVASTLPQPFRAYPSLEQGINDYVNLLSTSPRFRAALGTGNDVHAFANGLARGGYATDPAYAPKLAATAEQVRALREAPAPARLAFAPAPTAGRTA
jgi:flagellar protein FlgJ